MMVKKLIGLALLWHVFYNFCQEDWITIFIHGTVGLRPAFALDTLIHVLKDNIDASSYRYAVDCIRDDCFFYQNQPIQERGLIAIDVEKNQCLGASLFARLFERINNYAVQKIEHEKYYTFGWSGLISHRVRYNEARILLVQLKQELERLHHFGSHPKIRLICYSHGGNLALNLGAVQKAEYPGDTLRIDELYLIGTPVQKETDHLICSPLFKKIYNIYSRSDNIQRLDCFSIHRFFSKRHFSSSKRYTLPDKLHQIEIKLQVPCAARYCPLTKKKHSRANRSPGHLELWFFGWVSDRKSLYRAYFPLNPLPFALFARALISAIEHEVKHKHIIAEWHIQDGTLQVRKRHEWKKTKIPFIGQEMIDDLKKMASSCRPLHFTPALYRAHVNNIINLAHDRKAYLQTNRTKTLCGS